MVVCEMKKQKLVALVYSIEDKKKMQNWLKSHSNLFQIVEWTEPLTAPLQAAIAHFAEQEGVDGVLVDDHSQYDPIVLNRVLDVLKVTKSSLYSATVNGAAVYSASPARVQQFAPAKAVSNPLVRAS